MLKNTSLFFPGLLSCEVFPAEKLVFASEELCKIYNNSNNKDYTYSSRVAAVTIQFPPFQKRWGRTIEKDFNCILKRNTTL